MITRTVVRSGGGSGGGYGGAKLPSNLLHLSGTIRDEVVDWSVAPKTLVVKLDMMAANPETPVKLGGDSSCLSATADGFEVTDGTNTAVLTTTWGSGDRPVIGLRTETDGVRNFMRLVRID